MFTMLYFGIAKVIIFVVLSTCINCNSLKNSRNFEYPDVYRNESIVEEHFGTNVSDPYRWLEDVESPANVNQIKTFVDEQNNLTLPYVEQFHWRNTLRERMSELWNYPKYEEILKHGDHYFQFANTGLENQNVLYIQDSLTEPTNRRIFLDPNSLSPDGTVALTLTRAFSESGTIFAYGLSKSGSDWLTIHFRSVATGVDLVDKLAKVKFTDIAWKGDEGIFYGHYPLFEDDPVGSDPGINKDQKISYHILGKDQINDTIVFEFPENPNRILASGMAMSRDQKYLIVTPEAADGDGSYGDQSVYGVYMNDTGHWVMDVVSNYDAKYKYITNKGDFYYFLTNKDASKNCIMAISFTNLANWTIVVPENANNVMDWAAVVNEDYLVINYLDNVKSKLELWYLNGTFIKNLPIDMGSIDAHSGGYEDNLLFIKFVSFLVPNRIYYLNFTNADISNIELEIFQDVEIPGFDPTEYVAEQKFYSSKDRTPISMFLVHRKDLVRNRSNPAMLYGYGGFNINVLPTFAVQRIVFMQNFNGVIAIANIRGGGEFGIEWHQGGNLEKKQNVFDDFQSAAEFLVFNNYTNSGKVIIEGRSNGGLLVGACVNQRPDLFGAAIASVGVMDMLRYHLFTIGYSWTSEYGNPDESKYFPVVYAYSPLHNIRLPEEGQYPAVLVTTSDHDDRVVPAHSYKYTAELQNIIGRSSRQTNPLLLRVETEAGHGAGKPTSKRIEEQVDIFSFIGQALNLTYLESNDGNHLSTFSLLFLVLTAIALQ